MGEEDLEEAKPAESVFAVAGDGTLLLEFNRRAEEEKDLGVEVRREEEGWIHLDVRREFLKQREVEAMTEIEECT